MKYPEQVNVWRQYRLMVAKGMGKEENGEQFLNKYGFSFCSAGNDLEVVDT